MKELKCTFEERTSAKTGKKYKALFIRLSDNNSYEKIVLLSAPEIALIENGSSVSYETEKNNVFDQFK